MKREYYPVQHHSYIYPLSLKNLKHYFSTPVISLGFFSALMASAFIYISYFGLHWPLVQTLFGILALHFWLTINPRALFWSGFFTAALWFWWISLSFRYYDLTWMIPIVVALISITYGILFRLVAALPHVALRAVAFALFEYLHPLGFDWFRPALLFTGSLLGDSLWQLWIVLFSLALFASFKSRWRYAALALIPLAIHQPKIPVSSTPESLLQKIELVNTQIDQAKKWNPRYKDAIIGLNFQTIENAIERKKEAIVLPESAFPLYLNRDTELMERLLKLSGKITIFTGALYVDGSGAYNSAYLFKDGRVRVMHKVVLVPFGEADPLPTWIAHWIDEIFFDGAEDYKTAAHPSDFTMAGSRWRCAICYEATSEKLFKGDPARMVAISNNAWFTPSIEPTLQRLLMQMESNRHGTTILHSTNGPGTGIIRPSYPTISKGALR
ncbi:apolipoprotein N-acyltransferase [Hydrogenimonas sp.]